MLIFLLVLFFFLLPIIALWKVFSKAGQPGWASIVPVYGLYILTKIIGKPGSWVILLIIPMLNFIFIVWMLNLLAKSFGRSEAFTVGLVFLPFVFFPILGFGSSVYLGPAGRN